jgi:hypothetical protein
MSAPRKLVYSNLVLEVLGAGLPDEQVKVPPQTLLRFIGDK